MRKSGKLAPQPWMTAGETRAVIAALTAQGSEVRFVGGCVRDALLDRPVTDIDIATHDRPEVVMKLLTKAGIRAVPTGIGHGTVTAVSGGRPYEITTLRLDVETDGRRARVAFTDDWTADAARRDFTINALFCAPDGTLYDAYGGLEDLKAGRVRFVGDPRQRIREDVLRLLRFFRFHAHYGAGPPDSEGLAACRELAGLLPTLSAERVRHELMRLLAAPDPAPVVAVMEDAGILRQILPRPFSIGRLAALAALEHRLGEADALRRLTALLQLDEKGALDLAARLRMSNRERDRLSAISREAPAFAPVREADARARWFYRHGPGGPRLYIDLLLLHAADGRGTHNARELARQLHAAKAWRRPRFPLGGSDVLELGVPHGSMVGDLLARVESWWIDGNFRASRPECLAELRRIAKEGTGS